MSSHLYDFLFFKAAHVYGSKSFVLPWSVGVPAAELPLASNFTRFSGRQLVQRTESLPGENMVPVLGLRKTKMIIARRNGQRPFTELSSSVSFLQEKFANKLANSKRRLEASTGVLREVSRGPAPAGLSPEERYLRCSSNFLISSTLCITFTSQVSYSTGVRAFKSWCMCCNLDSTLVTPPAWFDENSSPFPHEIVSIGAFMCFLSFEKQLHPDTVINYVCAVRSNFRDQHRDLSLFAHPVLKDLRRSLHLDWASKDENAEHFSKTLPFTVEMLGVLRTEVLDLTSPLDEAVKTAASMGMTMLNRASELVVTEADHFIKTENVVFHMMLEDGVKFDCNAGDAYLYEVSQLTGVTTFLRSAKNDQLGLGYISSFPVTVITETSIYCVATDMFTWAKKARPAVGDPFLSHCATEGCDPWSLPYEYYNDAIKRTARKCGFDDKLFSSHSIRIGGATLLAAAGHPNHYIQQAGRWKSLAFLKYIHWAISSMKAALVTLVDPRVFTNADMKRLNPGAVMV